RGGETQRKGIGSWEKAVVDNGSIDKKRNIKGDFQVFLARRTTLLDRNAECKRIDIKEKEGRGEGEEREREAFDASERSFQELFQNEKEYHNSVLCCEFEEKGFHRSRGNEDRSKVEERDEAERDRQDSSKDVVFLEFAI